MIVVADDLFFSIILMVALDYVMPIKLFGSLKL